MLYLIHYMYCQYRMEIIYMNLVKKDTLLKFTMIINLLI